MATEELAAWLGGVRVAVITREHGRFRLSYTQEALNRYELGFPLLSLSLPLTDERYPQGVARAFLDGLLPEGEARKVIARAYGMRETDTFGLMLALGRDCAGALVFQPADEPAPKQPTTLTAERLSDDEIAELVANLRSAPLGTSGRVRISLAGVQEKLLLTRMPDGGWGRPVDGTPSTHILKPEIAAYPHSVENEAFCMRVTKHLGLSVANVETIEINGRKLIVVERYDRVIEASGRTTRLHQEDFCQATGMPLSRKYQEDGGPSLRRVADIVQAAANPTSVEALLRVVTLNVLIGNGDAHAKNFSLLRGSSGALSLAPAYDLMSTLFYGDDRLAMYIDDVRRTDRVTSDRLVKEAVSWGLLRARATEVVAQLLDATLDAAERAADETPEVPPKIRNILSAQLGRLRSPGP